MNTQHILLMFHCVLFSPPLLVVAGGVILFLVIIPIRRVYCNVRVLPTKFVGDIWPINAPDVFFSILHKIPISYLLLVLPTPPHGIPYPNCRTKKLFAEDLFKLEPSK